MGRRLIGLVFVFDVQFGWKIEVGSFVEYSFGLSFKVKILNITNFEIISANLA